MVTKIRRYPGIGGSREYTAGPTSDNTGQKFVTHHLHKWHRAEGRRKSSGNRRASVSRKNILGVGEAVNTDRTSNTNRPIILWVRPITGLFTGHRTNIARVSYGQRKMLVPGPAQCRAIVGRFVCCLLCRNAL